MSNLDIKIFQGNSNLEYADINIIIDVIRAFTVSYYAFKSGIEEIILASSKKEAFELKALNSSYLISGETNGYKDEGFDFGNSPYEISKANLDKKVLIQKTTNGVAVTLNSLNAKNVFVTGYINSLSLIEYIKSMINSSSKKKYKINIIASHPSGDDDLACAQYIKTLLINNETNLKELDNITLQRISNCDASHKFWDIKNKDFYINDLVMALNIENSNFIMEVKKDLNNIKIIKKDY